MATAGVFVFSVSALSFQSTNTSITNFNSYIFLILSTDLIYDLPVIPWKLNLKNINNWKVRLACYNNQQREGYTEGHVASLTLWFNFGGPSEHVTMQVTFPRHVTQIHQFSEAIRLMGTSGCLLGLDHKEILNRCKQVSRITLWVVCHLPMWAELDYPPSEELA